MPNKIIGQNCNLTWEAYDRAIKIAREQAVREAVSKLPKEKPTWRGISTNMNELNLAVGFNNCLKEVKQILKDILDK